jgi:3',5'-nucleoside bisphosphate phosphatase
VSRYGPASDNAIARRPRAVVDLHTHTTRSDGVLEPYSLVTDAAAAGVRQLAITDHDSLSAYRELTAAGQVPAGLGLVVGVEINALTSGFDVPDRELHILGYGMDPDDEAFEAALAAQREQRRLRFERTVARLRELDLAVDDRLGADTDSEDALGRPTVARALIAAGHVASVEDAFTRLLGWGKPAYIPRSGLGPVGAIAAISDAGGLPVLAHFGEAPARVDIVRELVDAGLGGLEVYYRSFDDATVAAVGAVARSLRLVPTGGTDYHGDLGPYAGAHARLWVPPEVAEAVLGAIGGRRSETAVVDSTRP